MSNKQRDDHGFDPPNAKIEGLQFHPESFLTPLGHTMISRWLSE
ncbi:MAG: hypothetical protein IPM86_03265 [Saprospiraceae bacterium]|nr:hypothetical protein [Saprospiraceae bacterium]